MNKELLIPLPFRILFCLIAVGCSWGFFADNDSVQIGYAFLNWPILLGIWIAAVASWFVRV